MLRCILAGLCMSFISTAHAQDEAWRKYTNPRFGVSCEYPAMFSRQDPPPENGDGQAFHTAGGDATLRVFGFHNFDHALTENMLAERTPAGTGMAYRMSKKDRFAYSGTRGATEVYLRCNLGSSDVVGCVELTYPAADSRPWAAMVTRISRSLQVK